MKPTRVALVGAGALGGVHATSLASIRNCQLTHVSARELSGVVTDAIKATGARLVPVAEVMDSAQADAVLIATPTDTHAALACQAIEAGLSVFCEKPLARTVAEAEQIRDMARAAGVKVAVGHVVRYFPEYAAARDALLSGELGRPATARLARVNTPPGVLQDWYLDHERSGGVLLDMAIHDIDWCLWTFGPVATVYAVRSGTPGAEVASVTLTHDSGVISYIDSSWCNDGFDTSLEVCGTAGMYTVGGSASAGLNIAMRKASDAGYLPGFATGTVDKHDPFRLELEAAIEWFRGGPEPLATAADGCEAVRVVNAADQSVRLRRPVSVSGGTA